MSAPSSCKFAMCAYHRQLHDEMRLLRHFESTSRERGVCTVGITHALAQVRTLLCNVDTACIPVIVLKPSSNVEALHVPRLHVPLTSTCAIKRWSPDSVQNFRSPARGPRLLHGIPVPDSDTCRAPWWMGLEKVQCRRRCGIRAEELRPVQAQATSHAGGFQGLAVYIVKYIPVPTVRRRKDRSACGSEVASLSETRVCPSGLSWPVLGKRPTPRRLRRSQARFSGSYRRRLPSCAPGLETCHEALILHEASE